MALASPAYSFAPCRAAPFTDNKDSFTPLYSDLTELQNKTFKKQSLLLSDFPFTVPDNGFMQIDIRCATQGRAYLFTGSAQCDGYNIQGGYIHSMSFVAKDVVLPSPTYNNINTTDYQITYISYGN